MPGISFLRNNFKVKEKKGTNVCQVALIYRTTVAGTSINLLYVLDKLSQVEHLPIHGQVEMSRGTTIILMDWTGIL